MNKLLTVSVLLCSIGAFSSANGQGKRDILGFSPGMKFEENSSLDRTPSGPLPEVLACFKGNGFLSSAIGVGQWMNCGGAQIHTVRFLFGYTAYYQPNTLFHVVYFFFSSVDTPKIKSNISEQFGSEPSFYNQKPNLLSLAPIAKWNLAGKLFLAFGSAVNGKSINGIHAVEHYLSLEDREILGREIDAIKVYEERKGVNPNPKF